MATLIIDLEIDKQGQVQIKQLKDQIKDISNTSKRTSKDVEKDFKNVNKSVGTTIGSFKNLAKTVAGLYAVQKAVQGITAATRRTDELQALTNRLQLVTENTRELERVQRALFQTSQQTRVSLEGTTDLYTRLARSTKTLNVDTKDLIQVTKTINQALIVSGANAQASEAALFQLGQGLGAGALRGEELNSVLEQTPRLAQAIADGLGLSIAQLREFASQGNLTAERVLEALKSQANVVNTEFSQMNKTIAQSTTQLSNSSDAFLLEFSKSIDIVGKLSTTIGDLSKNIDDNLDDYVSAAVTAYATIEKLVSGINLVYESVENGVQILVGAIGTTVYGALKPITFAIETATRGLNALGLASDDSLRKAESINKFVRDSFTNSTDLISDSFKEVNEAYKSATVSVEDRIKLLKEEAQANKKIREEQSKKAQGVGATVATVDSGTEKQTQTTSLANWQRYYEKLGDYSTAWAIEEAQIRSTYIDASEVQLQKIISIEKKAYEDRINNTSKSKQVIEDFNKAYLQTTLTSTEFEISQLTERYLEYQKYVEDKALLDEWYNGEYKKILEYRKDEDKKWQDGASEAFKDYSKTAGLTFDNVKSAANRAIGGLEDVLVDFVTTGKASFSDFANSIIADLARIVIQQNITKPLAQSLGSVDWGTLFSANGNAFTSNGVKAFANGGAFTNSIVSQPTFFEYGGSFGSNSGVMGEAGPEAILPLTRVGNDLGVKSEPSNVVLNIVNQTSSDIQAEQVSSSLQKNSQGQTERVIGIVIEAASSNKNNFRTNLKGLLA